MQHSHYMKCNFPRLSSGGENESSTRTTKWKQEAPRAPDSLSSTRCTMTSSGSELRMCKASAGTKDRTSSGILEEFFYLDRSLSLATAVRVCSLKYLLVRNRRVCDTHGSTDLLSCDQQVEFRRCWFLLWGYLTRARPETH